jgi:hypothetical protein
MSVSVWNLPLDGSTTVKVMVASLPQLFRPLIVTDFARSQAVYLVVEPLDWLSVPL